MGLKSVLLLLQKYKEGDLLTNYSHKIASFLSKRDVETDLVCFGEEGEREKGNLKVHEFSFQLHGDNYFSWTMLLQAEFLRKVRELTQRKDISVIHANEWSTVPAGLVASKLFELPLIITYHSVEEERGMNKPHSGHISELERQGVQEASYIVTHKEETRKSLEAYDLPDGKVKLLEGGGWKERLYEIYRRAADVRNACKNLERNVDKNESFDAYMGVPSA